MWWKAGICQQIDPTPAALFSLARAASQVRNAEAGSCSLQTASTPPLRKVKQPFCTCNSEHNLDLLVVQI